MNEETLKEIVNGDMSGAAAAAMAGDTNDKNILEEWEQMKNLMSSERMIEILFHIGTALLILLCGCIAITILSKMMKKALNRTKLDPVLYTFIINCTKVICWVMLIIAVLGYMQVPTAPFVAILGAGGAAVALALRDSLANFAGGFLILITKPFSKGDHISNLEIEGLVQEIDLLYSTLETFDHKIITIPNGKLTNSTIINYTKAEKRRVDCSFEISRSADLTEVKEILSACADSDARVLAEPPVFIGVADQKNGLVTVEIRVWCETEDYWDVLYDLQETAKLAFDEHQIELPCPQMEVRLKRGKK